MKHSILVAVLYLWALPSPAATYFISPMGNDSNAGTSAETAWASPKHSLNCGDIAYNSTQGSGACYSGLNIYQPIASDANPGTHMYVAGNFSYRNMEPPVCAGTAPTDGEGVNLDTFDFGQGGGHPYLQQSVVENNILVGNGGRAIEIENSNAGPSQAPIYIEYNTAYGDNAAPIGAYCQGNGEIGLVAAFNVTVTRNLVQTNAVTGCSGDKIYGLEVSQDNSTTIVDNNWVDGLNGNNTFLYASGSFAFGPANVLGTSPNFANPAIPSAPSCGGTANVPACMQTLIANFTPLTQGALSYGYQPPSAAQVYDPLFPRWLCNVNLPSGLVTMGCFRLHLSATVS